MPRKPVETAESWIPDGDLPAVREAALGCRACPLWAPATQTVFGEGPADAQWLLVGEVPGDREDLQGRPFVGPAGMHFRYKQSGKRRLHDRPRTTEVAACRPWVLREIALVKPRVVGLLGATAAKALVDPGLSVEAMRGTWLDSPLAPHVFATVHPSSLLRRRGVDPGGHAEARARFVGDLRRITEVIDA
jgi:uracil-DNA glycosylase